MIQSKNTKAQSPIKKQSALKMFFSKTPSKKKESATSSLSSMSARVSEKNSPLSSRKPPKIPSNPKTEILATSLIEKREPPKNEY